jgi:LacI family transcriptional regulator
MIVTMQDVAEKAKVSKATISRIINNKPSGIRISAKTQERVLSIIKELNYQPNIFAQSLKTKKAGCWE